MRFLVLILAFVSSAAFASEIDTKNKELTLKVLYLSVGSGAYENLEFLNARTNPAAADGGAVPKLAGTGVTYLRMRMGKIRGYLLQFDLYALAWNPKVERDLTSLTKGLDGVVFVAGRDPKRQDENRRALEALRTAISAQGSSAESMPTVLQVSASDGKAPVTVDAIRDTLRLKPTISSFEVVPNGNPVEFDTLKALTKLMLAVVSANSAHE